MITVRAGSAAIGMCLLLLLSACSREQQDWRSAEAADTIDSYGQFIQRHPDSELVTQARTRVSQGNRSHCLRFVMLATPIVWPCFVDFPSFF